MRNFTSTAIITLGLGLASTPLWADPAALLIGNELYQTVPRASNGVTAVSTQRAFEQRGYTTTVAREVTSDQIQANLTSLLDQADPNEPIAFVLTGHFVTSGENTWFLLVDTQTPTLANISRYALPLSLVYDIAARHAGQALVVLGGTNYGMNVGHGITSGIGQIDAPQGVTVLTGLSGDVTEFLSRDGLRQGVVMAEAVKNSRGRVAAFGFLPNTPAPRMDRVIIPKPDPQPDLNAQERSYWMAISDLDTLAGYESYLSKYPRGIFVRPAERKIAFIKDAPLRDARQGEEALRLNRDARRQIQSDLTLLGFNTRGIDGVFGSGTRGALSAWQNDAGFAPTGFINREQLISLREQARVKNEALKEQDRQREAQIRHKDRQYWNQTGTDGTENGLRAYLKRYPDGIFAEQAQEQLNAILEGKRQAVRTREQAIWDQTLAVNDEGAYRRYINEFPDGVFVAEARSRIEALRNDNSAEIAAAREEESRLGLAPVTFLLVEQRLAALGFEPGRVDGKLSQESRRAIRRFQGSANLPVTGYLSRATVVRLIAAR